MRRIGEESVSLFLKECLKALAHLMQSVFFCFFFGALDKAREVFQTALEFFGDSEEEVEKAQSVFSAFARMETRLKEFDRARVIYKVLSPFFFCFFRRIQPHDVLFFLHPQFALSRLPRSKSQTLYAAYTKFEKQHGTRSGVESTVLGKRRIQYEEELSHDANNYVRPFTPSFRCSVRSSHYNLSVKHPSLTGRLDIVRPPRRRRLPIRSGRCHRRRGRP